MNKRLIIKVQAIILAICVAFATMPTTAFAVSTTQNNENTSSTDTTDNTDVSGTIENEDTDTTTDIDNGNDSPISDESENTDDEQSENKEDSSESKVDNENSENGEDTKNADSSSEEVNKEENKDDENIEEEEEKEDEQQEDIPERKMGYRGVDDIKIPSVNDGSTLSNDKGTLPSSYDSRSSITSVKNQGYWGTCWSFSAIAMAEANLVKKGIADRSVDLSELQLAYFFYNSVVDELGNTKGDYNKALEASYLEQGGNSAFTTFALANWIGVTEEYKAPYEATTSESYALNSNLAYDDAYHMQNAYWINMTDITYVKSLIKEYGGVVTSYYSEEQDNRKITKYYNGNTHAYYYDGQFQTNHAVFLVGWDDNYSKSNFSKSPKSNGAWLVKNSWGSSEGDGGYFWLSYEDAALNNESSMGYVFDFEPADNYDHNYQYDGSSSVSGYGVFNGGSIANVFTAKGNPSGGAEKIEAVSFALYDVNVDYSIQIYTNLSNANDPASGTAMLSKPKTGRTSYVGYYTVKLDQPIEVAEGSSFSVVITLSKSNAARIYYFADESHSYDWIQFVNQTESGQSFQKTSSSHSWYDLNNIGATARIKAFTTNATLTQPTQISLNKTTLSLKAGESATLTAITAPIRVSNDYITWKTSNSSVATVDSNGKVTACGIGTAIITATTKNGISASCTVTGKLGKTTELKATQTTNQIKLSWKKQNGVSGYEIYRYDSNSKKYVKIATNSKASKNSYTDKSRAVGTTYQYKVRAYVKSKGKTTYGSYSNVLKTSTKTKAPTLKATAQSKKAKLTWYKIDGATGYEIYMSTKKNSGYSLIKTISKAKTVTYTKGGLSKKKTYYFKIRTYKTVSGEKIYSGYSKVVSVKIK